MEEIFHSFHCISFCITFTFYIRSETPSKSTMEHTVYSKDLGEKPINMNNEAK